MNDNVIEKNFYLLKIVNMDKVILTFDCPPSKTIKAEIKQYQYALREKEKKHHLRAF